MSDTETFDADAFLHSAQTDAVETKFTPVPAADYVASIKPGSIKVEPVPFKDGNTGARFTAQWAIEGEVAGMTNPTVRQQFLLDIDGFRNGAPVLRTGANQNIRLGRLIELSGQPKQGWTFAGLESARGRIKVEHRPDRNDAEIVYAEVKTVAAL